MVINRARLVLVARFGPARGAVLPARRTIDDPFELVGKAAHHHQRMAQIDRVIGAEAKLAAGLQLVGKRRGDIELLEISLALEGVFSRNPDLKRSIPDL